jgi:hypothetical protein
MTRSGLDFRQSSLDHVARISRSVRLADLTCLRFTDMLWSLALFRGPVSRLIQVRYPEGVPFVVEM